MFHLRKNLKILSLLGEGLNAKVYKVSKYQPNIKVSTTFALKVLKRTSDINHFKTEFESLLKANGKHIVKYRGWETYRFKPALLLEYINGVTLHHLLTQSHVDASEAAWIYQETLSGLKELEESGLYHGDLSPKNIMITVEGDIKLIDFGLTHWRTKNIELTPEFAAKSVLSGNKPSLESDITSLDLIYSQFNLQKLSEPQQRPKRLASKIANLQGSDLLQTKEIPTRSKKHTQRHNKALLKLLFIFIGCWILFPSPTPNNIKINSPILVRSSNWLAIRISKENAWCFTPCTLRFKRTGLQIVHWKNNSTVSFINVYIHKNQKTLTLIDDVLSN